MKELILLIGLISWMTSCDKDKNKSDPSENQIHFSIDLSDRKQCLQAFGASDAWSCQFVGKEWPAEKRERIAELLFSTATYKNGNPKGIGLSGWRFNIGGGSAEQGNSSEIEDEWRRVECFLDFDGIYNWEKQQGERWFLKAANDFGVQSITAFVNSPPVFFTKNGKAWSDGGSTANLNSDKFDDFSNFVSEVLYELKTHDNIDFRYISPVNEPQWDWNEKRQEGSPYSNTEIANLTRELSKALINKGLSVKIEIPDAGQLKYLYTEQDKPGCGKQAYEFFQKKSKNYIGDLPNVALKVTGHSYFSTYPISSTLLEERRNLADALFEINPDLQFWQTEYCLLEDNEEIKGAGRDLGMDPALYMARLIHFDLTVSNSCSWYWWLAVSPYDYKDGLLYIDKNKNDGNIYESKLLWALGNFSRFITPGMYRYNVIRSDNQTDDIAAKSLMVSAYGTEDMTKAVFVLVNYSKYTSYSVELNTSDNRIPKSVKVYKTSAREDENLKLSIPAHINDTLIIAPRSIITVVLEF